jgi:hypothetical protein
MSTIADVVTQTLANTGVKRIWGVAGDDLPTTELRLARLREQVAVVRTIADQIDHFAEPGNADGFSEQVLEEMTRLGCRLLETAAAMTRAPRPECCG